MVHEGYLLGLDIGSSSIKASLIAIGTGQSVAASQSPADEMPMLALQPGWAEQDPQLWWQHVVQSTRACLARSNIKPDAVQAIGIAYQMHGLVVVDRDQNPLRPAIIWCDSRAVETGEKALADLGDEYCLRHFLNSPGNFTASKLKWVKNNEPLIYEKIDKAMLPGDFIAMKMTGEITTTDTGLSEGIFWDYEEKAVSKKLLDYYGINASLLARSVPVFSVQGVLSKEGAHQLGLAAGTRVAYRAGDQPNNAFSLNVLNPGETAATAGTSGVIYSVTGKNIHDKQSRVNSFIHVNNSGSAVRNGVLLCVNGTGIQNSWLRKNIHSAGGLYSYDEINNLASRIPVGSDELVVLPFGNGAERILVNKKMGASVRGLNFNVHHQGHLLRAAQEGIVFALKYGFDILQLIGVETKVIRAGHANMFLSAVFREAFVNTIGVPLELYDSDGARGAAFGAGIGAGLYSFTDAFKGLKLIHTVEVENEKKEQYAVAFHRWNKALNHALEVSS